MGGTYSSEDAQGQADGQKSTEVAAKPSALVMCGPSGVGKGTLIKKLMDGSPRLFTSKEDFEKGIEAGQFLEYARVHSNIYGTSYKVRHHWPSWRPLCIGMGVCSAGSSS